MSEQKIFVGRKDELKAFEQVLSDPRGQGVLVVGQWGMGKTWLVKRMAWLAEHHPNLKCGSVQYEVPSTDSVNSTMALMMDDAFKVGRVKEKSFNGTTRTLEQWRSFLNVLNLGDLVMSLRRDKEKNTREKFLEILSLISKRIPDNGRAIFVIDSYKRMQEGSDAAWSIVVRDLPEKIKFVFAQRPDDVLVDSETFGALDNVLRIPDKHLDVLEEAAVDELLDRRSGESDYGVTEVRDVVGRYKGHPYALGAALDLIEGGIKLEQLPEKPKPTDFAEVQWKELSKRSEDAIRLFKGYAILEVAVPNDVVEAVSKIDSDTRQHLLADKYLRGLLREEGYGRRIYHVILAEHIIKQIRQLERDEYHKRATEVYRKQLKSGIKRETLYKVRMASIRLPEHVLESEGKEAFIDTVVNECVNVLSDLGELETAKQLGRRALETYPEDGAKVSAIIRTLARICWKQGQLKKAELLIKTDLKTVKKEKREEDMRHYDFMLAGIFQQRGQIDEAEDIYNTILQDKEKCGNTAGGEIFANLGVIYWRRGHFKQAANMQRRALRAYASSKNKEGMAEAYGNFGAIYLSQGNLKKASYAILKALKLTNRVDIIASMCSNLASIHMRCGRFDEAEDTLRKTLKINMEMGNIEGASRDLANLGGIHAAKGEIDKARDVWIKARDGYDIVGMKDMAKKVQGWIDGLSEK